MEFPLKTIVFFLKKIKMLENLKFVAGPVGSDEDIAIAFGGQALDNDFGWEAFEKTGDIANIFGPA